MEIVKVTQNQKVLLSYMFQKNLLPDCLWLIIMDYLFYHQITEINKKDGTIYCIECCPELNEDKEIIYVTRVYNENSSYILSTYSTKDTMEYGISPINEYYAFCKEIEKKDKFDYCFFLFHLADAKALTRAPHVQAKLSTCGARVSALAIAKWNRTDFTVRINSYDKEYFINQYFICNDHDWKTAFAYAIDCYNELLKKGNNNISERLNKIRIKKDIFYAKKNMIRPRKRKSA